MKFIGEFKELCPMKNFPSMKQFMSNEPYKGKEKIIKYLQSGNVDMARMETHKDVFSGEIVKMEMLGMNDGEYTWFNTLSYYVEKYNLRLPAEFERKVMES